MRESIRDVMVNLVYGFSTTDAMLSATAALEAV